MRMFSLAVALALVVVNTSLAQVLRIEVTGKALQTAASGTQITVDLSNLSGIVLVHIYDPNFAPDGAPVGSAGKVILTGTVGTLGAISEVRILVAGEDDAWPTVPITSLMATGVRDLGTTESGGIEVPDAALKAKTRLAAFTSHDIRGDITVGQVQRVQCGFNLDDTTTNGIIYANISTVARDPAFTSDAGTFTMPAMAYVRAGNAILGNLSATTDAAYLSGNGLTFATIGKIVVGPSVQAGGIHGDITALTGLIGSIYTAGPIGGTSALTGQNRTPKIWAGTGIREIIATADENVRAIDTGGPMPLASVAATIQADIDAGRNYTPQGLGERDGTLSVLETGGDISGEIHVGNVLSGTVSGVSSGARAGIRAGRVVGGVLVGGRITAPITVDHVMEGSIIGETIEAPITIGRMFEGSIIAWGGLLAGSAQAPSLPLISIGFGEPAESAAAYQGLWGTGFVGTDSDCLPTLSESVRDYAYPRPDIAGQLVDLFVGTLPCGDDNGEAGNSLIAAAHVADMRINRMSVWEREADLGSAIVYSHGVAPWIECRAIDHLRIDAWREGVVWSGVFDSPLSSANTDTGDDYASIGTVDVHCMGDGAALWARDCTRITVVGDVRGAVHLPRLESASTISIGGGLVGADSAGAIDAADSCGCTAPDACEVAGNVNSEALPTQPAAPATPRETGRASQGSISFADYYGLVGQIVINAANGGGSWIGPINAGTAANGDPLPITGGPHYPGMSRAYGGGAVGVVPATFYADDTFPPPGQVNEDHNPCGDPVVRRTDIGADGILAVRFYGPIMASAGSIADAFAITGAAECSGTASTTTSPWTVELHHDPAAAFGGARTDIWIKPKPDVTPAAGRYKITNALPGATASSPPEFRLTSAGLLPDVPAAPVPAFAWYFRLSDASDGCYNSYLDYEPDGVINPDDLGSYITDYFTSPPMPGPGGYAIPCAGNAVPYNAGYRAAFTGSGAGQCYEPNSDNLGDYITAYFNNDAC